MYLPGTRPKEPQSEIITRPLKGLLEHVGLGKAPDVVSGESEHPDMRAVSIYSHPVGGTLGSIIEHLLSPGQGGVYVLDHTESPPDPRRHWAVLVGNVFHELNADHNLNVVYQNGLADKSTYKWERFTVGWTKLSDAAIRNAGKQHDL